MEWNWDHAFAVLPQLADGLLVTIQATIVASLLAYVLGLGIAIVKMSKSKLTRISIYWITEFVRRTPILVQAFILVHILQKSLELVLTMFLKASGRQQSHLTITHFKPGKMLSCLRPYHQ